MTVLPVKGPSAVPYTRTSSPSVGTVSINKGFSAKPEATDDTVTFTGCAKTHDDSESSGLRMQAAFGKLLFSGGQTSSPQAEITPPKRKYVFIKP